MQHNEAARPFREVLRGLSPETNNESAARGTQQHMLTRAAPGCDCVPATPAYDISWWPNFAVTRISHRQFQPRRGRSTVSGEDRVAVPETLDHRSAATAWELSEAKATGDDHRHRSHRWESARRGLPIDLAGEPAATTVRKVSGGRALSFRPGNGSRSPKAFKSAEGRCHPRTGSTPGTRSRPQAATGTIAESTRCRRESGHGFRTVTADERARAPPNRQQCETAVRADAATARCWNRPSGGGIRRFILAMLTERSGRPPPPRNSQARATRRPARDGGRMIGCATQTEGSRNCWTTLELLAAEEPTKQTMERNPDIARLSWFHETSVRVLSQPVLRRSSP